MASIMDGKLSTTILVGIMFISAFTFFMINHNIYNNLRVADEGEKCTQAMFGEDFYAFKACQAENALQRNWYPSPTAKYFSYQRWNGVADFWQDGLVIENMVNFMAYANNTRYESVVKSSLRSLPQLLLAYPPFPSFDDMAWFGLSYLRVYEVLGREEFIHRAREIFDWTWQTGWDSTGNCSGGMWWDQRRRDKVSITNVLMLQLGIKLYRTDTAQSQDPKLLEKVLKIYSYIRNNDIIDPDSHQVADGIYLTNCSSNRQFGPTYTPGVLAVGLAHLSQVLHNDTLMNLAHTVLNSTIQHHSSQDGVLTEPCDFSGCSTDPQVFKGIFVRHVRYMMAMSDNATKENYHNFLLVNANFMLVHSSCWDVHRCKMVFKDGPSFHVRTVPVFGANWHGPFNYSDPVQQMSALDLLVSTIKYGTTCTGKACHYDPTPPSAPEQSQT